MQPSLRPLPRLAGAARQWGPHRRGAVRLLVRKPVLDQILAFSEQAADREQAGFLLGGWHRSPPQEGSPEPSDYVELRAFVPAHHTRERASSVTFTYDTWSRLRQDLQQHPGEVVVGWHHTHPGLGIFLSEFDRFIHRHFFGQPWQVALVVDPRRHELGFFQWADGRLAGSGFTCLEDPAGD